MLNIYKTTWEKNDLYIIILCLFLIIGAVIAFAKFMGNINDAYYFLNRNGYENIVVVKDNWVCEKTDLYKNRFTAVKNHRNIKGEYCCQFINNYRIVIKWKSE